MNAPRRLLAAIVGALAMIVSLSACGPGYQDIALPGSGVDGDSYRLSAAFDDAVNLAEGAQVKVDGLPVGRVHDIEAKGYRAVVALDIEKDIVIRQGVRARLRYDTPLGEPFVELTNPARGNSLRDGDEIAARHTDTAPSVEDTLAQASLLINGGGLTELQTINEELNTALGGREDVTREVLETSLDVLARTNASKGDIDVLLRNLAAAATALKARRHVFGDAINALGPLAVVLRADTPTLNRLLTKTRALTRRTNKTMALTQDALVQMLTQLGPILDEVLSAEPAFLHGMGALARADALLREAIPGDFVGLDAVLRVDLSQLLGAEPGDTTPPGGDGGLLPGPPDLPGLPILPGLPTLPGFPSLQGIGLLPQRADAP